MLELYQFELSQYSEKVRLILDYKGLPYRKIEVTPGVGQLEIFRLTGQRQVPVLKDGDTIVADSTDIAFYLDRNYPENPLIPNDPVAKGQCLLMEEWADELIGGKGRTAFIGAFAQNPNFRTAFLPQGTPDVIKTVVGTVPLDAFNLLGKGMGLGQDAIKAANNSLRQNLEALSLILQNRPYLIEDRPTLADLAVAGLSMIIKFPSSSYVKLPEGVADKGIPGLADNSAYEPFFAWRDRLYADFRQLLSTPTPNDLPTSINIE